MAKIIVIEGVDGVGKSTQVFLLCNELKKQGYKVDILKFPTYDDSYSFLVKKHLGGELPSSCYYTRSLFWSLDRKLAWDNNWNDWRNKMSDPNQIFIFDRYVSGNIILQSFNMTNDEKKHYIHWLLDLEHRILGIPEPDLTILLDLDTELVIANLETRNQKLDIYENQNNIIAVNKHTKSVAATLGWKIVDCQDNDKMKTKREICLDIQKVINSQGVLSGVEQNKTIIG